MISSRCAPRPARLPAARSARKSPCGEQAPAASRPPRQRPTLSPLLLPICPCGVRTPSAARRLFPLRVRMCMHAMLTCVLSLVSCGASQHVAVAAAVAALAQVWASPLCLSSFRFPLTMARRRRLRSSPRGSGPPGGAPAAAARGAPPSLC